jgi:hypothetical protein
MVQPSSSCVVEIHRVDGANGAGAYRIPATTLNMKSGEGEDGEFGAGVAAIEIF